MPKGCFTKCFGEDTAIRMKEPGIGYPLVTLFCQGLQYWFLLALVESRVATMVLRILEKRKAHSVVYKIDVDKDPDVVTEETRIKSKTIEKLKDTDVLIMADLKKYYKGLGAVRGLYLGVPKGQCFGLIGVNGAGKTSAFKMLTGNIHITFGDAYIEGHSCKYSPKQARSNIGYCPQFEAVNDDLTCHQNLTLYANLKGIQKAKISEYVTNTMNNFQIQEYSNIQFKNLSGGNKRKLSTAVALIGDPQIIFLDEPTAGVDPAAKRYLWNVLSDLRANGKTIILTSHSMEECEALCSRLAIMVAGEFKCLGSVQHLKSQFGRDYSLTIKLSTTTNVPLDTLVNNVKTFVRRNFHGILKEQHGPILYFDLKAGDKAWSSMFFIMQNAKHSHSIEDYSLSQTTLEQVFISFASQEKNTTLEHYINSVASQQTIGTSQKDDSREELPERESGEFIKVVNSKHKMENHHAHEKRHSHKHKSHHHLHGRKSAEV